MATDSENIDIWTMDLHEIHISLEDSLITLSEDEIQRADKFSDPILQARFRIIRTGLRSILSNYLHMSPQDIPFSPNSYGKPFVTKSVKQGHIEFNLSHSAELALLAVDWDDPLGIDVEKIKPLKDAKSIAQRYFCDAEASILQDMKRADTDQAFIQLWTAKEALIKGRGMGLSLPLNHFDCSDLLKPGSAVCKVTPMDSNETWIIQKLQVQLGFAASLAVSGPQRKLCSFTWQP